MHRSNPNEFQSVHRLCSCFFKGWAYLTIRILNREPTHATNNHRNLFLPLLLSNCFVEFKTSLGKVFLSLSLSFFSSFFFIQRKGYFLSEFINCDKVSLIRRLIDSVPVSHMVFNIDTRIEVSSFRSLYL